MKKALKIFALIIVSLALILSITGLAVRDKIEIPKGYSGTYLDVSGEKIRYFQTGNGPDILLIHGLPGSIEDWEPVMGALSKQHRVTAYDRPGHGFSSANDISYDFQDNARIALAIMEGLDLNNVIVVGHSYGGGVALALAIENPGRVKAFVSIAGVKGPIGQPDPIYYVNAVPLIGRGFAVIGAKGLGPKMIEEGIREAFHPNESFIPEKFINQRRDIWLQTKVVMTIAHESLNMNESIKKIMPDYGKIAKPFYILQGDSDKMVPLAGAVEFQKAHPTTRLTVLKDTGHQVQFVHPEAVLMAIGSIK